jgi:hypothetical protein
MRSEALKRAQKKYYEKIKNNEEVKRKREIYQNEYYRNNREERKLYQKKYYIDNFEKISAYYRKKYRNKKNVI